MIYTLTATCHFGTEAVLKREILDLGLEIKSVTDGHIDFTVRAPIYLEQTFGLEQRRGFILTCLNSTLILLMNFMRMCSL